MSASGPDMPSRGKRAVWILALDASLARCSAAVLADGMIRAAALLDTERGHAAALPPMVDQVLRQAGVTAPDLDAVAAVVGPGGFTGLRAALALAQGVALGAGLPVLGVTTGEALAEAVPPALRRGRQVWTAVDSKRGRLILERFPADGDAALGPPASLEEAELPPAPCPVVVAGDAGAQLLAALRARGVDTVASDCRLPEAAHAARVAARRLRGQVPPLEARPLYVEAPAVRLPA